MGLDGQVYLLVSDRLRDLEDRKNRWFPDTLIYPDTLQGRVNPAAIGKIASGGINCGRSNGFSSA
jgi:hypothetical protein